MAKQIKLQSSDGEVFDVDVKVVECFGMLGGFEMNEGDVIPLANVNSAILNKVIAFCDHHKDDPPEPRDNDGETVRRTDDISSWDADFLNVDQETLFELILAANYLDIKGLLTVTCKTFANMIKGKTPEEIRQVFNIHLTPALLGSGTVEWKC